MRSGFNTNVPFSGRTYHVQTEDCVMKTPVVRTLLYCEGEILATKETDCSPLLARPDSDRKIKKLMVLQHRLMIKELVSGMHTDGGAGKEDRTNPEGAGGTDRW